MMGTSIVGEQTGPESGSLMLLNPEIKSGSSCLYVMTALAIVLGFENYSSAMTDNFGNLLSMLINLSAVCFQSPKMTRITTSETGMTSSKGLCWTNRICHRRPSGHSFSRQLTRMSVMKVSSAWSCRSTWMTTFSASTRGA